jgi:hypothetical protein
MASAGDGMTRDRRHQVFFIAQIPSCKTNQGVYDANPNSRNASPQCAAIALNGHDRFVRHQFFSHAERHDPSVAAFDLSDAPRFVPFELRTARLDHIHFSMHGIIVLTARRHGYG